MPTSAVVASMRKNYAKYIHTSRVRVRIVVRETDEQPNPNFKAQSVKEYGEFNDFPCSYYHILSGKLTRVFRTVLEAVQTTVGLIDKAAFIVQFITHTPSLLASTGTASNLAGSATQLDITDPASFIVDNVRVGALVTNVTDGSTAIVTDVDALQLTTTPLAGGTDNQYTAGDEFTVHNYNDLVVDDQVYLDGRWRTVLAVVEDSIGVQTSVLVSE